MDSEELQESLEPVVEALSKHKGQIFLVLLLAVAAYAYLYIVPHPGTLTISVGELDGSSLNDAEVTVLDAATGKTLASDLTQSGSVKFFNMPAQKELTIETSKGTAYDPNTVRATIPSGREKEVQVDLTRHTALSFGNSQIPPTIPLGCADDFPIEVRNSGTDNFDAELLVEDIEGELPENRLVGVISVPDGKKTVYYNTSTNFSVRVASSGQNADGDNSVKSGKLRIKKTNVHRDITLKLSPKIQLEVSPPEVPLISEAKAGQKIIISLTNAGSQTVTGISFKINGDSDLRAACNNNIETCITLEQLGGEFKPELLPQSTTRMSLIISPPNQPGKTFLGSLEISADCLHKNPLVVPIKIATTETG